MITAPLSRFNQLLRQGLLCRSSGGLLIPLKSCVWSRCYHRPPTDQINQNRPPGIFSVETYDEDTFGYPTAKMDVLLKSLEDFNKYERQSEVSLIYLDKLRQLIQLLKYDPDARSQVWESGYVTELLKHRDVNPLEIQHLKNKALALLGYAPPYTGRGLRILSLDGGGIRGLIPIIMLRQLERVSGLKIDQMFDYVAGTSTGAIIASLLFVNNSSLENAESLYRNLSLKIFDMNNLLGLGQLFINQSFYDSAKLEKEIRLGEPVEREMIDTAIDINVPKMCFVSTVVNRPIIEPFLFTNYQHHPLQVSNYRYRFNVTVWKAIMASTAAPGYFEEVNIEKYILQDGALLSNNPSAIALHEARLLWGMPEAPPPIQSLISLGTGRYATKSQEDDFSISTSLREKLTKIVASATDTEAVHTVLRDLLPPSAYFRFNPLLSDSVALDDAKPERLQLLMDDAMRFIDKHGDEFQRAADSLKQEKTMAQKAQQWYNQHLRRRVSDWV